MDNQVLAQDLCEMFIGMDPLTEREEELLNRFSSIDGKVLSLALRSIRKHETDPEQIKKIDNYYTNPPKKLEVVLDVIYKGQPGKVHLLCENWREIITEVHEQSETN